MGDFLSISGTQVQHILQKNGNTIHEIGALSNYTKISCDRYVRQPYYIQRSKMELPLFSDYELDGLRLETV